MDRFELAILTDIIPNELEYLPRVGYKANSSDKIAEDYAVSSYRCEK
jgi:hypothetical protein